MFFFFCFFGVHQALSPVLVIIFQGSVGYFHVLWTMRFIRLCKSVGLNLIEGTHFVSHSHKILLSIWLIFSPFIRYTVFGFHISSLEIGSNRWTDEIWIFQDCLMIDIPYIYIVYVCIQSVYVSIYANETLTNTRSTHWMASIMKRIGRLCNINFATQLQKFFCFVRHAQSLFVRWDCLYSLSTRRYFFSFQVK